MNKYVIVIMSLILFCIPVCVTWAAYSGPTVIFSTPIEATSADDMGDVFALNYFVRSDGTYIEPNGTDINIYGPSGLIKKFSISQGLGFQSQEYFTDQLIYVLGSVPDTKGTINENIYIYDYNGNIKKTINYDAYVGGFEAALPNGDFFTKDDGNYYRYSSTGQLVKTYMSKPLELGVVKKQILSSGKYRTTVTFEDREYSIVDNREYINFQRDENKNIYTLGAAYVKKFSLCGKLLGQVNMPSDVVFREENVTGREPVVMVHDRYGEPLIDIHGNVYTWKKAPKKYSILKWTWVDDPSVPTGPDAPTGLTVIPSINGLYLTWTASAQDPGCVTGYEIARATSSGGVFSTVGTVDKGLVRYNDTTAETGTMYYYKVRAKAGTEYSLYTAEVSGKR